MPSPSGCWLRSKMPSNYPPEWWMFCLEHQDWDTNGDGVCRTYGCASRQARITIGFCRLVHQGSDIALYGVREESQR